MFFPRLSLVFFFHLCFEFGIVFFYCFCLLILYLYVSYFSRRILYVVSVLLILLLWYFHAAWFLTTLCDSKMCSYHKWIHSKFWPNLCGFLYTTLICPFISNNSTQNVYWRAQSMTLQRKKRRKTSYDDKITCGNVWHIRIICERFVLRYVNRPTMYDREQKIIRK